MSLLETYLAYFRAWFTPVEAQLQPLYIPIASRRNRPSPVRVSRQHLNE